MAYQEVPIVGYNANPPSDDGTEADQNKVAWDKHLEKIGDPLKDALEQTQTNITSAINEATFPPGAIVDYTGLTDPDGWLICDGRSLNSVSDTSLADLFGVIGVQYGGTGASDFNLPDTRGYFTRGFDNGAGNDPDAASRLDRGDGTTGDNIGTKQDHALEDHRHQHTRTNNQNDGVTDGTEVTFNKGTTQDFTQGAVALDGGSVNVSANETRAKNICFNKIIKK